MTTKQSLAYQVSALPNINIPKIDDFFDVSNALYKISAFNEPSVTYKEPKLSQWEYLDPENIEKLITYTSRREVFDFISSTLKDSLKGRSRDIFVELLCDTVQFCQTLEFDVEKSGTVLSQIYLTHLYFTSSLDISAEKVYVYFKDLTLCHSLPFPPSSKKVFTLKEAKDILVFFCRVYLRNLPLIRYLCLPNFALYLSYEVPPPPVFNIKEKKDKKSKDKGKKGKKKK